MNEEKSDSVNLREALAYLLGAFRASLSGKPIRDADEIISHIEGVLASPPAPQVAPELSMSMFASPQDYEVARSVQAVQRAADQDQAELAEIQLIAIDFNVDPASRMDRIADICRTARKERP